MLGGLLKGDKYLWMIIIVLSSISFVPIYSVSPELASKHVFLVIFGFTLMIVIHRLNYRVFGFFSSIGMGVILILLLITAFQGRQIGGANASRWLELPGVGFQLQPSSFAIVIGIVFAAYYTSYFYNKKYEPYERMMKYGAFLIVISLTFGAIFPANLSTALIFFVTSFLVLFLGDFSKKYLLIYLTTLVVFASIFIGVVKWKPDLFPNRVQTWEKRISTFMSDEEGGDSNWQSDQAKAAIAVGGWTGAGPAKSLQKNILPQASSDFVFAIILEEYGLIFGGGLIFFLMGLILFRINIIVTKIPYRFAKLLVSGLGFAILIQSIVNMGVSTGSFPVTGQTLPLLSSGGSSVLATYISFGIILSASKHMNETPKEAIFPVVDEIEK